VNGFDSASARDDIGQQFCGLLLDELARGEFPGRVERDNEMRVQSFNTRYRFRFEIEIRGRSRVR